MEITITERPTYVNTFNLDNLKVKDSSRVSLL